MKTAVQEGKLYRVTIDGNSSDGSGVARINGMVVFIRNAIRGELVDVRIEHVGRSAAFGRVEAVAEPSPARIPPDCPYYGQCGGCQFRHMTYEEELAVKKARVEDALSHLGGVNLPLSAIHGAARQDRYRNKVQFPASPEALGYYRHGTHKVVEVNDCLLQPRADSQCLEAVRQWMARCRVPAYDEHTGEGLVRHVYLRTNQAGEALCCVVANGRSLPRAQLLAQELRRAVPSLAGLVLSVNTRRTNVVLGDEYRTLWGRDYLEEELCGHVFRLSVPSFFQINLAQTEVLYQRVARFAALTGSQTVVELYCGIGTISLTLAPDAGRVMAVEVVPQAVEDARENARRNALADKTEFICGDAGELAARLRADGIRPDVVVVDPPRKGLTPQVVEAAAGMEPARVVYVSCDPATLARDVGRFRQAGYEPRRAEAVDLFPRTAHVETVVLMSRVKD